MGMSIFPTTSGITSAVKSVQRGTASGAGNITINAVDIAKTMVKSFSTGSAGTVAVPGTVAATTVTASGYTATHGYTGSSGTGSTLSMTEQTANLGGGTTNLVSAVYGVYLSNSTTLVATGPCNYEVVEYY